MSEIQIIPENVPSNEIMSHNGSNSLFYNIISDQLVIILLMDYMDSV